MKMPMKKTILAVLAVEVGQVLLLGGVAVALGWRPTGLAAGALLLALGTAAFVALGLLVAGLLRAEAVLALANLVWVLLLAGGAVLLPAEQLPARLAGVARALPSGALGEGLHRDLDPGADHPAEVLARSRDHIEGSRRSEIHNDARRSILR